ncbi:hypothetical protein V6N11_054521 [Hibiscus sabdariffa]|uniref:hAT-like transposase RNase-H fold domain-containing protein n=1 Tax=Hibiscus sabdariffa TaxID=183260 RepID=A0ABR2S4C0_9ROSI
MVHHDLKQVKSIIKNVHDTVDYLNGSEQRLKKFAELAQQYNLKEMRLVLECTIRWNSTYEMLDCAIKFKEYPTSNLFLSEVYRIKLLLDTSSKSSDDFVKGMVTNMKERENIHKVRETLYELYDEYVNLYSPPLMEQMGECGTSANVCSEGTRSTPGLLEILQAVRSEELTENRQFEVDLYLEEGRLVLISPWIEEKEQKN